MKTITFVELKKLNGKSIQEIGAYEEPTEPEKGIIKINGTTVFNCFSNKVTCTNDSFAFIHFYDKRGNQIANVSIFNKDECLIIKDQDDIYSQTSLRVLNTYNSK